jgi:hypothetical protein
MTRPVVGTVAEEVYAALGPLPAEDEGNDWALLNFVAALTQALEDIDDLVRDSDAGPGWSSIVDIDRVSSEALPWLAQLVGVTVDEALSDADQRQQIQETQGFQRGTLAALVGAVKPYLTGSKTVVVDERDTSAYHLSVNTFTAETPDSSLVAAALMRLKPAGLVLAYATLTGATYNQLNATGKTYNQLRTTYPTYDRMKAAILP